MSKKLTKQAANALEVTPEGALDFVLEWAGGARPLGKLLTPPVSSQAISQWKLVPVRHVLAIEELTGVPRGKLRPDVYPEA